MYNTGNEINKLRDLGKMIVEFYRAFNLPLQLLEHVKLAKILSLNA